MVELGSSGIRYNGINRSKSSLRDSTVGLQQRNIVHKAAIPNIDQKSEMFQKVCA